MTFQVGYSTLTTNSSKYREYINPIDSQVRKKVLPLVGLEPTIRVFRQVILLLTALVQCLAPVRYGGPLLRFATKV